MSLTNTSDLVLTIRKQRGTFHRSSHQLPPIQQSDEADDEQKRPFNNLIEIVSPEISRYQSEADEETQAREREETKRLVYVALTRARDRLYLSAMVPAGGLRMGRGSLGEILPASLVALFTRAADAGSGAEIAWAPAAERTHRLTAKALKLDGFE